MIVYNNTINNDITTFIDDLTEKIIDAYNIKIPIINMKEYFNVSISQSRRRASFLGLIKGNIK